MKKILCTLLILGTALAPMSQVLASYSANGRVFGSSVTIQENVDPDILCAALALLNRDPVDIIENWDNADEQQILDYQEGVELYISQILEIYQTPGFVINPYKQIVLNYYSWLDNIEIKIPEPIVADGEQVVYSVPELKRQIYTYMPIRAITSTGSYQYKFKPYIAPDERGYMRYGDAYSIALGQYYGTQIGTIYEITFENGQIIKGVLTDCKRTTDTDSTHRYADASQVYDGGVGNVVEFVFDDEVPGLGELPLAKRMNTINARMAEDFPSPVVSIKKVGVVDAMLQMYRAYDER